MKKKLCFTGLVGLFIILPAYTQKKYIAVPEETVIEWVGEKVTGEHEGNINLEKGYLTMDGNRIVEGEFRVDMSTITNNDIENEQYRQKLVNHLKSPDFFGVEEYPYADFKITKSVDMTGGSGMVKGDITIKGITRPIEFNATMDQNDEGIRFYSKLVLDRSKYNVRYGSGSFFDNLGDKTIYDDFQLKINMLVK
jgi:polyisoprenoid-binding protein YceI